MLPPTVDESPITLQTADGLRLEAMVHQPNPAAPWLLLSHPSPKHGASMKHKVITTAQRAAAAAGYNTLRYNFRGVGNSEGHIGDGDAELQDLDAAIGWVSAQRPTNLTLLGFSFGSLITLRHAASGRPGTDSAAQQLKTSAANIDTAPRATERALTGRIIAIAPPFSWYTIPEIDVPPHGLHVLCGADDTLCRPEDAQRYVARYTDIGVSLRVVENCDHFFNRRLPALAEAVTAALR